MSDLVFSDHSQALGFSQGYPRPFIASGIRTSSPRRSEIRKMVPWALQKSPSYLQRAKVSFLGAPFPLHPLLLRLSGLRRINFGAEIGSSALPSLPSFQSPENCQDAWKSGTRISSFGWTEDQCITSKRGSKTYHEQNRSQVRGFA